MISYRPFFNTLKRKNISQYSLENDGKISKGLMDNLRNNRSITLTTLEDLCELLDCSPSDIFEFVKEDV